jgi:hypothetical protein
LLFHEPLNALDELSALDVDVNDGEKERGEKWKRNKPKTIHSEVARGDALAELKPDELRTLNYSN